MTYKWGTEPRQGKCGSYLRTLTGIRPQLRFEPQPSTCRSAILPLHYPFAIYLKSSLSVCMCLCLCRLCPAATFCSHLVCFGTVPTSSLLRRSCCCVRRRHVTVARRTGKTVTVQSCWSMPAHAMLMGYFFGAGWRRANAVSLFMSKRQQQSIKFDQLSTCVILFL